MQRESELERYFAYRVRAMGGRSFKLAPTTAGIPDRLVMLPGGLIFLVELKTTTGQLSLIQQHWHAEIGRLGTTVYTLYGREQVDAWLTEMIDKAYEEHEIRRAIVARRAANAAANSPANNAKKTAVAR